MSEPQCKSRGYLIHLAHRMEYDHFDWITLIFNAIVLINEDKYSVAS